MGKPFAKELDKINDTLHWALQQDVAQLRDVLMHGKLKPLFVVGSGGSLSACYYAALLYQQYGMMAKAITPLELFYSQNALRESNILFISASGKNTDILFGYKTAISFEPNKIFSLCMKTDSALASLARETSLSEHFEFDIPTGKDGFLATNSLIAFFSILYNVFCPTQEDIKIDIPADKSFLDQLDIFIDKVSPTYTYYILYAGYGQPIAIDLESKLAEAALADVLISDYRNFGHGRHHWFDKRKGNSAIVAIVSPDEELIAKKTLELLPSDIPIIIIRTTFNDAFASIDLLMKSFVFVKRLGEIQKIDPGKPGVPEYGSKLYNLKYARLYKREISEMADLKRIAILRKTKLASINALTPNEVQYWNLAYETFKEKLSKAVFGSIIFDYDGTLCSASNRFNGIDAEITATLVRLLERGIIVGIATGRGQSVRVDLAKKVPSKYHNQVIIGYYNCAEIGLLNNDMLPNKQGIASEPLQELFKILTSYNFPVTVVPELKPNQITVEIKAKSEWSKVRSVIIDLIISKNQAGIQILESSHSMDIIDQSVTSKLNIIEHCEMLARELSSPINCLCIGDKGQWPGNDYQLLTHPYSLSVDEVSSLGETGWNLAVPGIKNTKSTIYYLSCLSFPSKGCIIDLP